MSFKATETAWRHNAVASNATFVIAVQVAATAEAVDIAIVIRGHSGLGSTLQVTTLADFAVTFAFAFRHKRLGIELDIGRIMTEAVTVAESALAMLLKVETRLLCTAILMMILMISSLTECRSFN